LGALEPQNQELGMRHILSVLVENKPGVLARISGLFSSRGYNIQSLTVGETEDAVISRMTIVVTGDDAVIEQIRKQLDKLVDVIKVVDLTGDSHIDRELCLVKVKAGPKERDEIIGMVAIFRAKIVDVTPVSLTVEITGGLDKNQALLDLLLPFGILELVRTGAVAIARGSGRALDQA
jgi:acetolactate synthase-1/3 small subunit